MGLVFACGVFKITINDSKLFNRVRDRIPFGNCRNDDCILVAETSPAEAGTPGICGETKILKEAMIKEYFGKETNKAYI